MIATGVSADRRREVLGCALGDSETEDFWAQFLLTLRDRGPGGTQLVISDHHRGLMNAIGATMVGATSPRDSLPNSPPAPTAITGNKPEPEVIDTGTIRTA